MENTVQKEYELAASRAKLRIFKLCRTHDKTQINLKLSASQEASLRFGLKYIQPNPDFSDLRIIWDKAENTLTDDSTDIINSYIKLIQQGLLTYKNNNIVDLRPWSERDSSLPGGRILTDSQKRVFDSCFVDPPADEPSPVYLSRQQLALLKLALASHEYDIENFAEFIDRADFDSSDVDVDIIEDYIDRVKKALFTISVVL